LSTPSQTVARAILLLKLIASSKARNLRLIDIAEMAALDKSTAHRLLQRLVQERMLVRDPGQRGYRLGPLLHELGIAALPETNLREISESSLRLLAQSTGDMAFLIIRSGFETVCLNRIAGDFEIQTLTRNIGDRHPIGVGAGGLALLASLNDSEVDIAIDAVLPQLGRYSITEAMLRKSVENTRQYGRALDENTAASGISAVGRAIRSRTGVPLGAVFVASISSRMTDKRLVQIDSQLATCVRDIEANLAR
jgi:DNA-binding IclR family transcriptional regulator